MKFQSTELTVVIAWQKIQHDVYAHACSHVGRHYVIKIFLSSGESNSMFEIKYGILICCHSNL